MNKLTLIVFSLPFLSACSPSMPELPDLPSLPSISDIIPTPYKADLYQGSVLERFKTNQLKVGMSKAQVQDLIGSPSIVDPFHNNQWDYINHSTPGTSEVIHYRLILTFDNNSLTQVDASGIDSLPQLTSQEKALEEKRIAEEKAKVEAIAKAKRIAKEKAIAAAQAKAKAEKIAKEKAQAAAKVLEEKRLAEEKAKVEAAAKAKIVAEKIAKEKAQAAAKVLEEKRLAEEKAKVEAEAEAAAEAKRIEAANRPWYKFW